MSATCCTFIKPDGSPCAAHPLPNSDFCLFHDPDHQQSQAESRSKGGSAPRRRLRRFPRLLDHMHVAELLGELFVDSLNDPDAIDTRAPPGAHRALPRLAQSRRHPAHLPRPLGPPRAVPRRRPPPPRLPAPPARGRGAPRCRAARPIPPPSPCRRRFPAGRDSHGRRRRRGCLECAAAFLPASEPQVLNRPRTGRLPIDEFRELLPAPLLPPPAAPPAPKSQDAAVQPAAAPPTPAAATEANAYPAPPHIRTPERLNFRLPNRSGTGHPGTNGSPSGEPALDLQTSVAATSALNQANVRSA